MYMNVNYLLQRIVESCRRPKSSLEITDGREWL